MSVPQAEELILRLFNVIPPIVSPPDDLRRR